MSSTCLKIDDKGSVRRIVLDTPSNRNALGENMMSELAAALGAASDDKTVRVVILAATGKVFCAGHDLKELTAARADEDRGRAYFTKIMTTCSALMQQIVKLPKPVIAEVGGIATAAGCQLVASCDLAVAGKSSAFATPGVQIGLFCSTPMVALSRNVSRKHAMEMLLTGEQVSAPKALELGLVNRVVEDADLTAQTLSLAETIAGKSAMTLKIGKEAFYEQIQLPLNEAYDYAASVMVENMLKRDAEEGIGAFIEKRQPNWQDE